MNKEAKKAERIIDKHKSDLKSISKEIIKGTSEGIKEGIADGLKSGVKDGLDDCFTKGFMNIGQDDIQDILKLEDIAEGFIKGRVKKGAKYIFQKSTKDYLKKICEKLIDEIQKGDVKLSKDQTEHILNLIKKSKPEALEKAVEKKLPNNFLFREVVAGMKEVWEDSLAKEFEKYENKIQKEIADVS